MRERSMTEAELDAIEARAKAAKVECLGDHTPFNDIFRLVAEVRRLWSAVRIAAS